MAPAINRAANARLVAFTGWKVPDQKSYAMKMKTT
jgi:hypothetical protein